LFKALPIAICGVVRTEALCGVRSASDRSRLIALLDSFHQLPTPEPTWDAAGDNLHTLRTHGVTIPLPDAVLATLAILNDIELWTRDAHFALIQKSLPSLKLFQEPP
jgi:predicted nucleic acid-binding protein